MYSLQKVRKHTRNKNFLNAINPSVFIIFMYTCPYFYYFPYVHLRKEIDIQVQEAERVPNKMDANRTTPTHIIIKVSEVEDKENLKSRKRKADSYL